MRILPYPLHAKRILDRYLSPLSLHIQKEVWTNEEDGATLIDFNVFIKENLPLKTKIDTLYAGELNLDMEAVEHRHLLKKSNLDQNKVKLIEDTILYEKTKKERLAKLASDKFKYRTRKFFEEKGFDSKKIV